MTIRIRTAVPSDAAEMAACHRAVYGEYGASWHWDERNFAMQIAMFPEGQFVAVDDAGHVWGYATSLIVQLDDDQWYKDSEITGSGSFATHSPAGDTLYGADIGVHPDKRRLGISSKLYIRRKEILRRHNLRRMVAHGRIPGYRDVAGRLTAEQYVREVIEGKREDPALSAHLKAGYRVRRVVLDYLVDARSLNYSTILEYLNDEFDPDRRLIAAQPLARPVRKVRVCAAQYRMRAITGWDDLVSQVTFFAQVADDYHCHFLLLPEYFSAQILSTSPPGLTDADHVRMMVEQGDRLVELFERLAHEYGLYIVGGSHLVEREGRLFNVAHMITPSGHTYHQDKLHITPFEREDWGVQPGENLRVFETPLGRVGVLVCYDVEFPELTRILTLSGIEILFVPFSTDDPKGYHRVRYCAHARAVENYIYVAISGNVGTLPGPHSYGLNYGRSAVVTPSDSAFPPRALLGEADPNVETVVIADLDLTTLAQQREIGSVRPLRDMRNDLYDLRLKIPIERIRIA